MKKVLAILLAVAVLLPCLGSFAFAKDAYILQENPLAPELPYEIMYCTDKQEIHLDGGHRMYGYTALDGGYIKLNFPVDILKVYDNGRLVFDSMNKEGKDSTACFVNWRSTIRPTDFNYKENCSDGYIDYLMDGTQISSLKAGHTYTIECHIGDDMCGEGNSVSAMYPHLATGERPWFAFDVYVLEYDDSYVLVGMYPQDGAPSDDGYDDGYYGDDSYDDGYYGDDGYYEEPWDEASLMYDTNLLTIDNVVEFVYNESSYVYTAVCSGGTTLHANKDLMNFSVERVADEYGNWMEPDFAIKDGYSDLAPSEEGFLPAYSGETYTLTKPGLYNIWAEDYAGNFTMVEVKVIYLQATYTDSTVLVDGKPVSFEAYNINDNNYFKLRDIAAVLSGSNKQFAVEWDAVNACINLVSYKPYTIVSGELAQGDGSTKLATAGTSNIRLDGYPVDLKAYMINGNNYFKLRDLGQLFDFDVSWDGVNNCIRIDSANQYTPD